MTQDNTALVEEMMRNATPAEEPGLLKKGGMVPDGSKDLPLGVTELKSAGYVFIYDTLTGEPSRINRNMLRSKLQQTRTGGGYVFSLKQTVTPVRGTYKCLLHPDAHVREYYDQIGLATCKKSNLTSLFQVERHMQKRHHQEWETIKNERDRKEKQEDRDFQKSLLAAATGGKSPPPAKTAVAVIDPGEQVPPVKRTYKKHKHRAKKE
jgi:hypothetical protein